jgi:alpha-ketoglutarate-dependent taurine dioxygenase
MTSTTATEWRAGEQSADLDAELARAGYLVVPRTTETAMVAALSELGQILHTTDVAVRPERPALVTSSKALAPHTDHHRADIIAWYCVAQADHGGETLLVDGVAVLAGLEDQHKRALTSIRLYEHRVFPDDPPDHALLEFVGGRPRLYWSYWLAPTALPAAAAEALAAWREALDQTPLTRFRLAAGDALVVDNRRILHGRTAIEGPGRLLRRYWVARKEPHTP